MKDIKQKVKEVYENKKYWKPPSLQFIADKLGISKTLVFNYLKEIKK